MRGSLASRILVIACAVALSIAFPVSAYATPSANDATITTAGATLTDASGNVWTFTAGGVVDENGVAASFSANAVEMAYVNGIIYHKNTSGQWWQWTGRTWTGPVGDPLPVTASASGSTVTVAGQTLTDASGNVWTFNTAAKVIVNGMLASVSGNVVEMAYVNGTIYHENTSGQWWKWMGSTWMGPVADPLPFTPSASGSTVTVAGQTLIDSNGNVWTFNTAAKVTENGMLASISGNVVEVAYVNGVIYHKNTSGQWWKWIGTTWTGPVANPLPVTLASCTDSSGTSHASGSTYTLTISTTAGTTTATTAQCPYGGTQPTTTTITQTYLCTNGTATAQGNQVTTTTNSGTLTCNLAPVNGTCGSSNGTDLTNAPTINLCTAGNATSVTGSGPWTWTCYGINGGANASCKATFDPLIAFITTPALAGSESLGARLGINAHSISSYPQLEAAGFNYIRTDACWQCTELSLHQYTYTSSIDPIQTAALANGLKVLWLLDYGNTLYSSSSNPNGIPIDANALNGFVDFAVNLVEHLPPGQMFEIYNEPEGNGLTNPQIAALWNAVIPAIKAADPTAHVITGALAGYIDAGGMQAEFNDGFPASGVSPDGIGLHAYIYPPGSHIDMGDPETLFTPTTTLPDGVTFISLPAFDAVLAAYNMTAPVWVTEGGYNFNDNPIPADSLWHPRMIVRWLLNVWAVGFPMDFLYSDVGADEYGILDHPYDLSVVTNLTTLANGRDLTGYTIDSSINGNPDALNLLRMEGSDDIVYAVWMRTGTYDLSIPAGTTAVDMFGNSLNTSGGSLAVNATNGPVYVTFIK